MHAIASKPSAPLRNPPRSSYAGIGGQTVRLEAPDELPGTWTGPVYATLSRDPQAMSSAASPFFDEADGIKHPVWQAVLTFLLPGQRRSEVESTLSEHVDVPYGIPHWRLTQPSHDLRLELQERPLLSVFRFLRFTEVFVASPRCDTKFTKHTSEVYLCGQVLTYVPAASISLVDDADLLQEPGCHYLCMVALRCYADERRQVVAIPLADVWGQAISRDEFVLGFYHGFPATLTPTAFASAWRSFVGSTPATLAAVRPAFASAFPAPGAVGGVLVDLGSRSVSFVNPRGTKTAAIPTDYAWRHANPLLSSMETDGSPGTPGSTSPTSELPLLTREEAMLTPGDTFSVSLSAPMVTATGAPGPPPGAISRATEPGSTSARPSPSLPLQGLTGDSLLHALLLEQRKTNAFLRSQLATLSASFSSLRQQGFGPEARPAQARGQTSPSSRPSRQSDRIVSAGNPPRPFDHFLSADSVGDYHQDRTGVHEESQWNGHDLPPRFPIRRADQLHQVLYVLQDAVTCLYPHDLVAVFRAVHGDAVQALGPATPAQVLYVMCNLYQAIFADLFDDILHAVSLQEAGARALRSLRHDSPLYNRFVTQNSSFLAAGPSPLVVPSTDAAILDALIADSRYGIPGTLALFRGQTLSDPRPNKALRPWLYRAHLASYPDLDLLCLIATHGVIPPWKDPSSRFGVRPVPANYIGAITGATVVTDKLLADYYKGRCIIATVATLERDPRFHSSAFALVPKKAKPLHLDGRIIHDLSAPDGQSVNAQTSSEDAPDASWDPFVSIARRIRDLQRRYPGYAIYAIIADIADAFHHVPIL
ncbi:unnamed protein product [Phytophthora fragariaefolia]|uniref:Unnamed protein product n=1 Tax=Phytophthora fragariaefolia TaxID=1490495 RepID=A0A9W6Y3F6_9STRA|nr:unnamed protein product [Phytophthora fragariaefolia]